MTALEAEAQAQVEAVGAEGKAHPGVPEDEAQRNFTDPESRIVPASGVKDFLQAYNCQAVVMIDEVMANTGRVPKEVSAYAGYYSATAASELQALGTDPFDTPGKTRHGHKPPSAPRGRILKELAPRDRMQRKLQTRRGRERYAWRRWSRSSGRSSRGEEFRQFLLRGMGKVQGEWSLICTGHNLLKLFRLGATPVEGRMVR